MQVSDAGGRWAYDPGMTGFPQTLKHWRGTRRLSQLDLAVEAEVSARHISFLETGRARPSREMIARLSDTLRLPLHARNQLLTHAGFAPRYASRDWTAPDMAPIRAAVDRMLERHAPYPAIAADRLWRVVKLNAPAQMLFGLIHIGEGDSLLDLMQGDLLPQFIENWPEVAHHSVQRLRTESAAQGGVAALDAAAAKLSTVPAPKALPTGPVIPTTYRAGDLRLSLFSTIAQFGTPEDQTLDDLKIELFFPADTETDTTLQRITLP